MLLKIYLKGFLKCFQDGEVDAKEFSDAVQKNCMNKSFAEMPAAFKAFIDQYFKSIDVDGNFLVKKNEIWACANCSLVKIREKF